MRVVLTAIDRGEPGQLARALSRNDVMVDAAPDVEDAFALVSDYSCDALVLSVGPRPASLVAIVRKARQRDGRIALMVHGVSTAAERLACFNAGADEVLAQDCDYDEVIARLHAIVRRSKGHSSPRVTVGNLCLDVSAASITVDGRRLELTRKEFRMLEMLVLQSGMSISKAKLLDGLYFGGEERDEGIIGVFLCMLRKKLREAGAQVEIETFRGVGYTLREQSEAAAKPGRVDRRATANGRARYGETLAQPLVNAAFRQARAGFHSSVG